LPPVPSAAPPLRRHDTGLCGMDKKRWAAGRPDHAAGNGVLDRRHLFAVAATASTAALISRPAAAAGELAVEPWMQEPGSPFVGYGQPSRFEAKVVRVF